jgi:hypothetical protein
MGRFSGEAQSIAGGIGRRLSILEPSRMTDSGIER